MASDSKLHKLTLIAGHASSDNKINQTILVKQLKKRGVVVEAVDHGLAAVERIRQVCSASAMPTNDKDKPFDVTLMDVNMPGESIER